MGAHRRRLVPVDLKAPRRHREAHGDPGEKLHCPDYAAVAPWGPIARAAGMNDGH